MSLYISPATSLAGSENLSAVNLKPTLNEKYMNNKLNQKVIFPNGIFRTRNNRGSAQPSRYLGETPFFRNAKPTSMLEKGWIKTKKNLPQNVSGLYTVKDGPEIQVTVVDFLEKEPPKRGRVYRFVTNDGMIISANDDNRSEEWDFYYATPPKAFVPRKGGRKTKRRLTRRKA